MANSYELITTSTDSLLLGLLIEKPMYGYEIIKELKDRSRGYFNFKEGTLYPALHRMETSGLVAGKWQTLSSGQQRKYYHITEKGRIKLLEKRNQWRDFLSAMNLIIESAET
jgi:PadR family transcriptional regulator PadR